MNVQTVYVAEAPYDSDFESRAMEVGVVCAGDSLTGWNNFGCRQNWPFPTYPEFLHALCQPWPLRVADGGVAGEVSDNGLHHVTGYLHTFPHARYFVIGFGTNDLGAGDNVEATSQRVLDNLAAMVEAVRGDQRTPVLFNVPNANERLFTPDAVADLRRRRDYHNRHLSAFCESQDLPLVDIRSVLHDEHFGDALHPNEQGARIIADQVFEVLQQVYRGGDSL